MRELLLLPGLALFLLTGCVSPKTPSPYDRAPLASRDTARAHDLNAEAVDRMASDPVAAETLLRAALAADLFHGPAHNNLGVVFLERGELYAAAQEFEWAKKLLPGQADPRLNLGLALERAAHVEDALREYRGALAIEPDHIPTQQALARAEVQSGKMDAATRSLLSAISLRGESEAWRSWAQRALLQREQKSPERGQ